MFNCRNNRLIDFHKYRYTSKIIPFSLIIENQEHRFKINRITKFNIFNTWHEILKDGEIITKINVKQNFIKRNSQVSIYYDNEEDEWISLLIGAGLLRKAIYPKKMM